MCSTVVSCCCYVVLTVVMVQKSRPLSVSGHYTADSAVWQTAFAGQEEPTRKTGPVQPSTNKICKSCDNTLHVVANHSDVQFNQPDM